MAACMLSETSVSNVIVNGTHFFSGLKSPPRCLRLHHQRISTMQGIRKGNLIPQEDNLLEQLHKSKHRARVFGQFCTAPLFAHDFQIEATTKNPTIVKDFRIQHENEKLLRKLTEIAEGKLVIFFVENLHHKSCLWPAEATTWSWLRLSTLDTARENVSESNAKIWHLLGDF